MAGPLHDCPGAAALNQASSVGTQHPNLARQRARTPHGMSTHTADVLTHQNKRLAVQLESLRHNNRVLEDRVQQYDAKEEAYSQTLLCVNRLWTQLNSDIAHLVSVATGGRPRSGPSTDPFLQRLLHLDRSSAKPFLDRQKALHAESSELEDALIERAHGTKAALASLLQHIQDARGASDALSLQLASSCGSCTSEAAAAQGHKRLVEEGASLRQQLGAAHAASRSTAEQLRLAEDRQLEARERIKALQNELADREQELSTMQTKYFALTTAKELLLQSETSAPLGCSNASGGGGGGVRPGSGSGSAPQVPPGPGPRISGSGGSGSGWGAMPNGSAAAAAAAAGAGGQQWPSNGGAGTEAYKDELADIQQLLARRTADLDLEREQHLKTQRELQDVLGRVSDEAWVPTTRMYQLLSSQAASLAEQLSSRVRDCEAMCRERDAARREADTRGQCVQAEAFARSQLCASEKAYRELQFAKSDADRHRQELELQLAHERSVTGSPKTVGELKLMASTLQQEVEVLQKHMRANKVTHARVEAAAQQCLESRSVLLTRESEVQRLQDRWGVTIRQLSSITHRVSVVWYTGDVSIAQRMLSPLIAEPRAAASAHTDRQVMRPGPLRRGSRSEGMRDRSLPPRAAPHSLTPPRSPCAPQVRRTEARLMAASVSEAALASRVGDLTAFVEVLVHLCDDPREVAEVRASEASLRAQLEAANARSQVGRWCPHSTARSQVGRWCHDSTARSQVGRRCPHSAARSQVGRWCPHSTARSQVHGCHDKAWSGRHGGRRCADDPSVAASAPSGPRSGVSSFRRHVVRPGYWLHDPAPQCQMTPASLPLHQAGHAAVSARSAGMWSDLGIGCMNPHPHPRASKR
ncbi:MAG: hypothetical protein WDW38_005542 [Sanguina aurantia]